MTIRKGTIVYTFMFDDTVNSVDEVNAMGMEDITEECMSGHMLGQYAGGDYNIVEVPNDEVAAEECALGCDGTFFTDPDELEDARLDSEGEG